MIALKGNAANPGGALTQQRLCFAPMGKNAFTALTVVSTQGHTCNWVRKVQVTVDVIDLPRCHV